MTLPTSADSVTVFSAPKDLVNTKTDNNFKRVLPLDGLRGIAVLIVLLFHYLNNQYMAGDWSHLNKLEIFVMKITSLGWSGVNLFFILSGYLIGSILLKNKNSHNFFKVFYIRRFARIIPIYYVLLIVYLIARHSPAYQPGAELFEKEFSIGYYFLFLQNFMMSALGTFGPQGLTPTWSLAVEEQFYLIIPLIVRFVNKKYLIYFIGACIALGPVSRYLSSNWYAEYTHFFSRIDSPVMGFLIAYLLTFRSVHNFFEKNLKILVYTTIVLIGLCSFIYLYTEIGLFNHTILGVIFGAVVLMALHIKHGIFYKILTTKSLLFLGKYSYCIYLFHQITNHLFHLIFLGQLKPVLDNWQGYLVTGLALAVTILFSVLSFKFLEGPLLRWAHKYKYQYRSS
jgi:peptidoglycan/LPS O-acetylase OafA/YrhL